jgi:hypothetical protein
MNIAVVIPVVVRGGSRFQRAVGLLQVRMDATVAEIVVDREHEVGAPIAVD